MWASIKKILKQSAWNVAQMFVMFEGNIPTNFLQHVTNLELKS